MTDSFVVRMVRDANAARRVVGEVEVVATGQRVLFRDSEELLAIIAAQSVNAADAGGFEPDVASPGQTEI